MTSMFHASGRSEHAWKRDEQGAGLVLLAAPGRTQRGVKRNVQSLDEFPAVLERREADLLDIGTAVFGSDRLAQRPNRGAHFLRWRRELHVCIPTREPSFWSQVNIRESLEEVLFELTDDQWHLEFFAAEPPVRAPTQLRLPTGGNGKPVALFSGGLDSLAGTLVYRQEHGHLPWLVSVASNSHIAQQQAKLVGLLRDRFAVMPESQSFRVHGSGDEPRMQGKRQRARSFLYFVLATLVARRVQSSQVLVLENGVTSLNLPISPILTSSRATRTTHPMVLASFERMVRTALDWPEYALSAPHQLSTKAEMVLAVAGARDLVTATVSCARVRTGQWCGTCTACLLRRQVLWVAGLGAVDEAERPRYKCDIFEDLDDERIEPERRWYLLATLDQVSRVLNQPESLSREPSLVRVAALEASRTGTSRDETMKSLIDLHVRYAKEWSAALVQLSGRYAKLKNLARIIGQEASS